jgi:hypothetical protein
MPGWTKLHASITESELYRKSPLYARVFEYLVIKAGHDAITIPWCAADGIWGRREIANGAVLTTLRSIAEGVAWIERGRMVKPSAKTIRDIVQWLETNGYVSLQSSDRKNTLVTILQYDSFGAEEVAQ